MLKKILVAVAIVAFLGASSFAGWYKWDLEWPHTHTTTWNPQKCLVIPVEMKIPYFIKFEVQPIKIVLEQVGEPGMQAGLTFSGCAMGNDDPKTKPDVTTNFACTLSGSIVKTAEGTALQPDNAKWSKTINPSNLAVGTTQNIDICVTVQEVNLAAFNANDTKTVANLEIYVIPQGL